MNRRDFLTFGKRNPIASASTARLKNGTAVVRNKNLTPQETAARFLMQTTFGPTEAEIDQAAQMGIDAWLENQFSQPRTETLKYMWDVIHPIYFVEDVPLLSIAPFRWAWWQAVMRNPDQLRQRVAMGLSEIMVISTRTDLLEDISVAVASYYDMLLKHAFGNFGDLLFDMATHPAMGYYLSHAGNRKANPALNRFPDENFAREIMQLFSIGLFELNQDGTRKKDAQGNDIPTYNNDDIKEFAKVFTGLTYQPSENWPEEEIDIDTEEGFSMAFMHYDNAQVPMVMYDEYHDTGSKQLLNGYTIPAGQSGMQDVRDTINHLFNHPNVGPFVGRLLIQRLVTSNPSPAYIGRVAAAFNNNGAGVRGDMKAVIRAIVLDDEARNLDQITNPRHGMLREPFIRYAHVCRALEVRNINGEERFYNLAEEAQSELAQAPFHSPSVFNFFSPDYRPLGPLNSENLAAPEFQITTSVSAIKLFNFLEGIIFEDNYMELPDGEEEEDELIESEFEQKMPTVSPVVMNPAPYDALEGNVLALIERLDLLFTYGSMSGRMKEIITKAVTDSIEVNDNWQETVRFAIIMVVTCPEYAILL